MNQSELNEVACKVLSSKRCDYDLEEIDGEWYWDGTVFDVKNIIQYHLCAADEATLEGFNQLFAMVEFFKDMPHPKIKGAKTNIYSTSAEKVESAYMLGGELQWLVARVNWCLQEWGGSDE